MHWLSMYVSGIYGVCVYRLKEELGQLERQYSRQPKREEIEQRIRELTRDRDDFKSEIKKVLLYNSKVTHIHTVYHTYTVTARK